MPVVEKRVWVAFDQSGTYRAISSGAGIKCMQEPLDEVFTEYLHEIALTEDLPQLRKFVSESTVVCRNLPVNIDPCLVGDDLKKDEFRSDILSSVVRSEQETGLLKLAQNPNIGCTMVSAMPSEGAFWAWYGLGEIGRNSVYPDRQMILRKGRNTFVTKLAELLIIKHGLDQSDNERRQPEKVFLIDDDLNLARLISRLLQIPVLVPIDIDQEANYPLLPIPKALKDVYEEVYVGAGLPELSESLDEYLTGQIPEKRFNAYSFLAGTAAELLHGLSLEDFKRGRLLS